MCAPGRAGRAGGDSRIKDSRRSPNGPVDVWSAGGVNLGVSCGGDKYLVIKNRYRSVLSGCVKAKVWLTGFKSSFHPAFKSTVVSV